MGPVRLRSSFRKHLHAALAGSAGASGWGLHGMAAMRRFDNGYWGRVVFEGGSEPGDPLWLNVFAGVYSGYLLRIQGGIDDSKPLPWRLRSGHVNVVYGDSVQFSLAGLCGDDAPCVGPDDATEWLTARLDCWCPAIESFCNDEAVIDWLSTGGHTGEPIFWQVRDAAMLARHARMDGELPALLERAKELEEQTVRMFSEEDGKPYRHNDRIRRYSLRWSHERFLRFMEQAPLE